LKLIVTTEKVAKSTITRRGVKEDWTSLRLQFQEKKQKKLMELNATKQAEVEERQLRSLQMTQNVAMRIVYEVGKKTETGTASVRDVNRLASASIALNKAIMLERTLLGLRTKPVTFRTPEDIEEYQILVGLKEPPADALHNKTKQAVESLDRIIERRQMLQSMIDEVDERGSYQLQFMLNSGFLSLRRSSLKYIILSLDKSLSFKPKHFFNIMPSV
jgi:hypothetical protein